MSLIPTRTGSATAITYIYPELKEILGIEYRHLVSIDYKSDSRSAIVDAFSTMVVNDTQLKLYIWNDNEMGYAHHMMELCRKVAGTPQ